MQTLTAASAPAAPAELLPPTPAAVEWSDQYATIALAQAQDHAAFEAVFERYHERIFNFVMRMMGGNTADAEELTGDVFLKAYLSLPRTDESIRYDSRLQSWLFRLAYNRCLDEHRHRKLVQWQSLGAWLSVFHPSQVADAGDEPERAVLGHERRAVLHEEVQRVLDQLKPIYRACLVLKEYFEYSYDQIAAVLKTTRAAVKSLLHRARQSFAALWTAAGNAGLLHG